MIFLEPARIYRAVKQEVADDGEALPLDTCFVLREGSDITLVTWGAMVKETLAAAATLAAEAVSAEVIDVATLKPLDFDTILTSVEKTGRCVIVHEAALTGGFGAEIAARIAEKGLLSLQAPLERVAGYDTIIRCPGSSIITCRTRRAFWRPHAASSRSRDRGAAPERTRRGSARGSARRSQTNPSATAPAPGVRVARAAAERTRQGGRVAFGGSGAKRTRAQLRRPWRTDASSAAVERTRQAGARRVRWQRSQTNPSVTARRPWRAGDSGAAVERTRQAGSRRVRGSGAKRTRAQRLCRRNCGISAHEDL